VIYPILKSKDTLVRFAGDMERLHFIFTLLLENKHMKNIKKKVHLEPLSPLVLSFQSS
jgi:hypothetical protein